jgi:hypothetical protein
MRKSRQSRDGTAITSRAINEVLNPSTRAESAICRALRERLPLSGLGRWFELMQGLPEA